MLGSRNCCTGFFLSVFCVTILNQFFRFYSEMRWIGHILVTPKELFHVFVVKRFTLSLIGYLKLLFHVTANLCFYLHGFNRQKNITSAF